MGKGDEHPALAPFGVLPDPYLGVLWVLQHPGPQFFRGGPAILGSSKYNIY